VKTTTGVLKFCTGVLCKTSIRREFVQIGLATAVHELVSVLSPVGTAAQYGLTVRGSNPSGGEIFRTCPDWPWGPPATCTVGNGFLSRR